MNAPHADDIDRIIDRAVELLDARIGMRPDTSFRNRLRRCITDEAARRALDVHAYVESLAGDRGALQALLNRVTVQETAFFRHPAQFEVLERDVLPAVAKPVTIWCAASANGQEAYSLAMVLVELGVTGSVVASDVSTSALDRTDAAWYSERELSGLTPERRARHLEPSGDGWSVVPSVRSRVRVMPHNLLDAIPDVVASCQVVFCRNVLIYFSSTRAGVFLGQLAERMPADSFLFVGAAETLWQVTTRFEPIGIGTSFIYRPVRARPEASAGLGPRQPPRAEAPERPAAARQRKTTSPRPAPAATPAPATTVADLQRAGHAAMRAADVADAIAAFRKWAYLDPDDVMAHLNLGFALERDGHTDSARAAYTSARAALRACDPATIERALGGYRAEELTRLLDLKLEDSTR